ncbi:glycosyltransferase family 4 protein [Myxococcus sp. K15C18031901]|uniref:glycosyltransferase family 4 protein n=1 Tax=Myxococcus dinghuensis TaxID=2906761 RepID=UPI0020A7E161|nr:glycosyltransferase family 4 protein [Myxococcus dinghuensis]MCP3104746.1 glycosyltransferase family 4 protein [Myxococcus dinghuensis]
MRILLAIHHPLDPNQGAPGVTLSLGKALAARGCEVEYYDYRQAFPEAPWDSAAHGLRFPWTLARWLSRQAHRFDVLDVTTGDSWPWARLGRPGAKPRHALVTRSHGLEHVLSDRLRIDAREGRIGLSWKYPLYHGGFRLWEVRQTLLLADRSVLLNPLDAAYARERLGVPGAKLSVIPHGLDKAFLGRPAPRERPRGPLRVVFVGNWLPLKGRDVLVSVAAALHQRAVPFTLSLLGTGASEVEVRGAFPEGVRPLLRVVPRYAHADLPALLESEEVLLFPSHTEGFGMAIVEAMACGLAPVSTPVGIASELVQDGVSGWRIPVGDTAAPVVVLASLATDPARLLAMRRVAHDTVQSMSWAHIAGRTLGLYEEVLRQRTA